MKLILLIVLSCMVAQSISLGRSRFRLPQFRLPRFRLPRFRLPQFRLPRFRIPRFPSFGKRDALPADDADDADLDSQMEDTDMSFADLARLLRELPEYDETARSVDDFSMVDHDSQEYE